MDIIDEQLKKQSSMFKSLVLSETNSNSQEPLVHTHPDEY